MTSRTTPVLAAAILLAGTITAAAQTPQQQSRPERPYRGLYASGTDEAAHVLSVSGSAGGGYDTSASRAASESGLLTPGNPEGSGGSFYNQLSGGLTYSGRMDRFSAGAALSTSARLYSQSDLPITASHAASGGLSTGLWHNASLSTGVSVGFQSTRGFSPFAELADPTLGQVNALNLDYGTGRRNNYSYGANVGFTQQLSRRSSLSAGYDQQINDFSDSDSDNQRRHTGSFRFTRSLTRYLGLRLGYSYTTSHYGGSTERQWENHNLDTGVDYSRDLSLTRRTRLSFSSGGTAVRQGNSTRYDVIGSARLNREIARTWNADLSYQRSVGFLGSLREPAFYDSINSGINGMISRRLSFHAGASGTRGMIGVTDTPGNGFWAWTASTGLNTALSRHLSLGVSYTFYRYNFEANAAQATGLLSETNRHSVSANLSVWAPLLQRGRRPSASR